jgi:hypothetical protein
MNRPLPFAVAATLALAACSPDPAPVPEPSTEASPLAPVPADDATPTPEAAESSLVSRYTPFDLARCEVLREEREEGSSADYRCPGLPGTPLLVQEGDGRFDLDAGVDDDGFQTIGAFNDIGPTVEWRTRDGEPFAVIFRFLDRAMMDPGRTVLAVEKIGRPGAPGCRVAQIAGDTPEANARARALADRRAEAFRCGADETVIIGEAR